MEPTSQVHDFHDPASDDSFGPVYIDAAKAIFQELPQGYFALISDPAPHPFDSIAEGQSSERKSDGRKKRVVGRLSQADVDTRAYHETIRGRLHQDWSVLRPKVPPFRRHRRLRETSSDRAWLQIDWKARLELKRSMQRFTDTLSGQNTPLLLGGHTELPPDRLLYVQVRNTESSANILEIKEDTEKRDAANFLVPPHCSFVVSDDLRMPQIVEHCRRNGPYHLIVIDPSWPNKSVSRSSEYDSLDIYSLFQIPLAELTGQYLAPSVLHSCMIVVWVTNRPKFRRFVQRKFFPDNGITLIGEWFWLKLAQNAEPIFDLDGLGRKPYEGLMIGQVGSMAAKTNPPHWKLFASYSLGHSRKPFVDGLLAPFLPNDPQCLELFARNLRPGWTSWGIEVLQHQQLGQYIDVEA